MRGVTLSEKGEKTMDIYSFCGLCSDDSAIVSIWDYAKEEEVFCGFLRDAAYGDFGDYEIIGFDLVYPRGVEIERGISIILNIESEEEEE